MFVHIIVVRCTGYMFLPWASSNRNGDDIMVVE